MNVASGLSFTQPRRTARIGLTSLIDVIFMLLMFFMLATSFEQWRSIQLTSGERSSVVQKNPKLVLVRVHPDFIVFNGQRVQLSQIASMLGASKSIEVIVKPIGDTRLQRIVSVMDQLRVAGINSPVLDVDQ